MRVSGYGEFQQMRKLASKEDAQTKNKTTSDGSSDNAGALAGDNDAVQISSEARQKIRMRQASDLREARVADVREKMNAGTLVTPESLKRGTAKMLDGLISGDL